MAFFVQSPQRGFAFSMWSVFYRVQDLSHYPSYYFVTFILILHTASLLETAGFGEISFFIQNVMVSSTEPSYMFFVNFLV
jgi:hypothetical protein